MTLAHPTALAAPLSAPTPAPRRPTCRSSVLELPPRRALLYIPGDSDRKICKAAGLGADVACLDLEDAVAASRKPAARDVAVKARPGSALAASLPGSNSCVSQGQQQCTSTDRSHYWLVVLPPRLWLR
jgi:hypothetical protein